MGDNIINQPVAIHAEVQVAATFSKASRARLNEAREKLIETKKQMLDDLSRQHFTSPLEAAQSIVQLQGIQCQVDALADRMQSQSSDEFTKSDVETMREMKHEGRTEAKIAEFFDTNQTKVNRLLRDGA